MNSDKEKSNLDLACFYHRPSLAITGLIFLLKQLNRDKRDEGDKEKNKTSIKAFISGG